MPVTAFYAAILAPLFLMLSFRTIQQRGNVRVELGHGEDRELLRRIRVHANFAEYVPFALLLIGLAESLKAPQVALHAFGLVLLLGRLVHAYGLSQTPQIPRLCTLGMQLTMTAIVFAALTCFALAGLNLLV